MGPHGYAELIDRLLNTFEYLEKRPGIQSNVQIPTPTTFYWYEKFFLTNDKVLTVTDGATFDSEGNMLERLFGYDFRDKGSDQPIFRVCNHTEEHPIDFPCHVHVGHEKNVVNCFQDSRGKDFPYVLHCIKNFYLGKDQDWDKAA